MRKLKSKLSVVFNSKIVMGILGVFGVVGVCSGMILRKFFDSSKTSTEQKKLEK